MTHAPPTYMLQGRVTLPDAACLSSFGRSKKLLTERGHYVVLLPSLTFIGGKIASLFSGRSAHVVAVKPRPADLERPTPIRRPSSRA